MTSSPPPSRPSRVLLSTKTESTETSEARFEGIKPSDDGLSGIVLDDGQKAETGQP